MAALGPAESLFPLDPNRTPARGRVKVTLLRLVARRGVVRLEERQVPWRFFGTRKTVQVRPAGPGRRRYGRIRPRCSIRCTRRRFCLGGLRRPQATSRRSETRYA